MLDWLRRFFQSDDPIVKVADGLNEFDAAMRQEALRNSGIENVKKNMAAIYDAYWRPMLPSAHFALFVRQSDLERARELLEPFLTPAQLMLEEDDGLEGPEYDS